MNRRRLAAVRALALALGDKRVALEHRDALLAALTGRGPAVPQAALDAEAQVFADLYEQAGLDPKQSHAFDAQLASLDRPPVGPFLGAQSYRWVEDGTRVAIGSECPTDPSAPRHALVRIAVPGGGKLLARVWLPPNSGGDGSYARVDQVSKRGASFTLFRSWCRVVNGYGVPRWGAWGAMSSEAGFWERAARRHGLFAYDNNGEMTCAGAPRTRTHPDVEFVADESEYFKTFDRARAAIGPRGGTIDVVVASRSGARWLYGNAGADAYDEDPDASVFERLVVRADGSIDSLGRVP